MKVLKTKKSDLTVGIVLCAFGIFLLALSFFDIVDDVEEDTVCGIFFCFLGAFYILFYKNFRFYFDENTFYHHGLFKKPGIEYEYSDIENAMLYGDTLVLKLKNRDTDYKLSLSDYSDSDAEKFGDFIKIVESYVIVENYDEDDE